ncbi:MAG: hypothetical protein ACYDGY_03800 [Acidimicrobiales bacterium]
MSSTLVFAPVSGNDQNALSRFVKPFCTGLEAQPAELVGNSYDESWCQNITRNAIPSARIAIASDTIYSSHVKDISRYPRNAYSMHLVHHSYHYQLQIWLAST